MRVLGTTPSASRKPALAQCVLNSTPPTTDYGAEPHFCEGPVAYTEILRIIPAVAEDPRQSRKDQGGTRREALAVLGVDPDTGKARPIQLAYEKLKSLPRMGTGKVKEAAYVVPEVLSKRYEGD